MNHKLATAATFAIFAFTSCPSFASVSHREEQRARASAKSGHYEETYSTLHRLARNGHPCAQCLLGIMYQKGKGVPKDCRQAALWYKKSAQKGFADAQNRLGHMYLNGDEIEKDSVEAEHWLTKAAHQGVAEAQAHLGKLYITNAVIEKKMREGHRLILLAKDQGLEEAQTMLDEIPGYQKVATSIEAKTAQAERGYAQGLGDVETSWEGYADLVKSMDAADAAAASK